MVSVIASLDHLTIQGTAQQNEKYFHKYSSTRVAPFKIWSRVRLRPSLTITAFIKNQQCQVYGFAQCCLHPYCPSSHLTQCSKCQKKSRLKSINLQTGQFNGVTSNCINGQCFMDNMPVSQNCMKTAALNTCTYIRRGPLHISIHVLGCGLSMQDESWLLYLCIGHCNNIHFSEYASRYIKYQRAKMSGFCSDKKIKPDTMLRAVMICINKTNTSNSLQAQAKLLASIQSH